MTSLALTSNSDNDPAKHVSQVNGLNTIKEDGVPAVVWNRPLPEAFQSWFDGLAPENLLSTCVNLRTRDVCAAVLQACEEARTPESPERNWLINDVVFLADSFAGIMSTRHLQLRFDVVSSNACKKFHTDVVNARLICTYRGPGTQYGVLTGGTEPDQVFDVRSGSPIILRGTRWPNQASSNFRHRSPPIQGLGKTRLNLVLDALNYEDVYEDYLHIHPEWVRGKAC